MAPNLKIVILPHLLLRVQGFEDNQISSTNFKIEVYGGVTESASKDTSHPSETIPANQLLRRVFPLTLVFL